GSAREARARVLGAGCLGLLRAALRRRLSVPESEEVALSLLEPGAAHQVLRHLAPSGCAVLPLDRREDPAVLGDRAFVRGCSFARADRVEGERAAERLREAVDGAVVRSCGDE